LQIEKNWDNFPLKLNLNIKKMDADNFLIDFERIKEMNVLNEIQLAILKQDIDWVIGTKHPHKISFDSGITWIAILPTGMMFLFKEEEK